MPNLMPSLTPSPNRSLAPADSRSALSPMLTRTSHHHVFLLLALILTSAAHGQQPEGVPADWKKLETAAETEYKNPLEESGAVDAKIRGFLRDKALPQLGLESNRATIEKTRRRMRDFLLGGIADGKAYDDVSRVILEFMVALARDAKADAVVRVNAMLLVGELRGRDNKQPWPPAAPVLAATVADAKLPAEIRIAALAGLTRHLEAAKATGTELPDAKAATDALTVVLTAPTAAGDVVAANWLLARALMVLPAAAPTLPKDLATAVVKLLEDPSRPIDVRVRAAAALGAGAKQASALDAAKAVAAVQTLAIAALTQDLNRVAQQKANESFSIASATDASAPPPKEESRTRTTMAELACRRNAWRLVTLADAIATEDGTGGLAALLGKAGDPARELATALRTQGMAIDDDPSEEKVAAAAESLGASKPPSGAASAPEPASQPAPKQDAPAEPVNPFAK